MIRFKFSARKARSAIHWMLSKQPAVDLHTALKGCYFSDKSHLNKHSRPIFGATYRAMKYGPVPLEIYEMAKGEAIWLAELGADSFPWMLDGFTLKRTSNCAPELDYFSETDVEELEAGFAKSCSMDFNERTEATHGFDWQAADLGIMRYEDMLEGNPNKEEIIRYLTFNGRLMRL